MVNVKLGNEKKKDLMFIMPRAWDKEKNLSSLPHFNEECTCVTTTL